MKEYAADFPKMSTQELIEWAKTCHSKISIHAYDGTYRKFMKHNLYLAKPKRGASDLITTIV